MANIFIGWSRNKTLAHELESILKNANNNAIVGGGAPKDMFIGAQVINQINLCDSAILLVEDKDGQISPNLMFEWGYIMAKLPVNNVYAFLINKSSRELPSDLLGTWVSEIIADRNTKPETEIAREIFDIYAKNSQLSVEKDYFDYINNWKEIFIKLQNNSGSIPEYDICEYVLVGCLAAYYYMDNAALRLVLNTMTGSSELNDIICFSKSYIDVFIKTGNMLHPLPQENFFKCMQTFDMLIGRTHKFGEQLDMLLDILCYDVYGLACYLYLKNENIDTETIKFCSEKAKECFEKCLEVLTAFSERYKNNECLIKLLRSYIYNDLANLINYVQKDTEEFMHYLSLSVETRKDLHQSFVNKYPNNFFLATKLEQEYILALGNQCNYMDESFLKSMYKNTVVNKLQEWERELVYTSSLTERIKQSVSKF